MKDAAGKTIQIGDKLFYGQTSRYACFGFVEVLSMTPKGRLRCKWVKHDRWYPITDETISIREGDHCVIVERAPISAGNPMMCSLFNRTKGLIDYWATVEAENLKSIKDRLDGLTFSFFSMIDDGMKLSRGDVPFDGPLHELWSMYGNEKNND